MFANTFREFNYFSFFPGWTWERFQHMLDYVFPGWTWGNYFEGNLHDVEMFSNAFREFNLFLPLDL